MDIIAYLHRVKSKSYTRLGFKRSAGPYLKIFSDDVFIVSYPRSGNTWMRFLIAGMVFGNDLDFFSLEDYVPDIYRCTHFHLEAMQRPRYIKSHEPYTKRYPKVIYLVRDPRDVVISYYKWLLKFQRTTETFDEFVARFVSKTEYGGWKYHVSSWLQGSARVQNGFLLIRYEDLLTKTLESMEQVARFLNLDIPREDIEAIIKKNHFDMMREKEKKARNSDLFKHTNPEIYFVRKGTFGQWKEHLSRDQIDMFAGALGDVASQVKYDLSSYE